MRTRDEVVIGSYRYTMRENGWTVTHVDHENTTPVTWPHTVEMIERIRELEQERHEDQGVISVWRGRTERAEQRIRELEAQQAASEPVVITDAMVEAGCREHYEYTTGLRWDDANSTVQYMWRKDARIMLTAAFTHPTTPTRGSDE